MRTFLVAYDLNRPGQNYPDLIRTLQGFPNSGRPLESTWVLKCALSAVALRDLLRTRVDPGDELLVVDITGDDWASWLPQRVNAWLVGQLAA